MSLKNLPKFSNLLKKMNPEFRVDVFYVSQPGFGNLLPAEKPSLKDIFQNNGLSYESEKNENVRIVNAYYGKFDSGEVKRAVFKVLLDIETRILLCFSKNIEIPVENILREFSKFSSISPLRLGKREFSEIEKKLSSKFPSHKIPEFTASISKNMTGELPSESSRTFLYSGDDGRETLEKLNNKIGTCLEVIKFKVPETLKFTVDSNGSCRCEKGKHHFLNMLREILEIILKKKQTHPNFIKSSIGRGGEKK